MRLPRPLRRLLDPHTGLITGFKSALRAQDSDEMARVLFRYGRRIGLRSGQLATLQEVTTGRLTDTISHGEAGGALRELAKTLPANLSSTSWLTLENIARTIGCFAASHDFSQGAHRVIAQRGTTRNRFLSSLHQRDVAASVEHFTSRPRGEDTSFWDQAGHYLWLWSHTEHGQPSFGKDSRFERLVSGHSVTILGPAPTSLQAEGADDESLVARVIMQEVLNWDPASDPLSGACHLAYASRETRNWLRETDSWTALQAFDAVSFRLDNSNDAFPDTVDSYLRLARDPRALMLGGSSPNMIPMMVWDVLGVPDVEVTLGGTTFFASKTAYTKGNRRLKHTTGKATDATGSTGELFERCPTFARHNVTENLTLVSNLITSGAIQADAETEAIAQMSIHDYLDTLDELYGKDRL